MLTYAQIWELIHGRKPTPEELEESRTFALAVLDELELAVSDSEDIWAELDP